MMFETRRRRGLSSAAARPWLLALGALPLLGGPAVADEQDPAAVSGPTEEARSVVDRGANEFLASTQEATSLARTPDGGTVVAWHSRKQQQSGTYGVYARLFDRAGDAVTGELQVNANTLSSQTRPAVDVGPDGSVWIVWESLGHDGDQGSIVARRFTPDLARATPERLVNGELSAGMSADEVRASGALGHQTQPVVCAHPDGGAWIAWTTPAEGRDRVALRRVHANGRDLDATLVIDDSPLAQDGYPCLARSGDTLVCAFARRDCAGVPTGIHARRLTLAGEFLGESFALHAEAGQHIEPALSANASGQFAIAFLSSDGEGRYVPHWRRFDGESLEPLHELDSSHEADRGTYTSGLEIALDESGRGLAVWGRCGGPEREPDLWALRLGADGQPQGAVFRATHTATRKQRLGLGSGARRAWLAEDGSYALAWSGFAGGQDSSAAALSFAGPGFGAGRPVHATAEGAAESPARELAGSASESPELESPTWGALGEGAAPHRPPVRSIAPAVAGPPAASLTGAGGFQAFLETSLTPPDPELAIGPDHAVAVVNDGIRFFTLGGVLTFADTISQPAGFFDPSGVSSTAFVFDPEALFDPHSGRFLVMANARTPPPPAQSTASFFLLSVSDDSNPNGSWSHYIFDVTSIAGGDIDSPNFSVDDSFVYLTADFFTGGDKFLVFVVEKAPLLSGGTPQTGFQLLTGSQSFGVPLVYDAGAPGYMIQSFESGSNSSVRLWAIQGGTNPTLTSSLLSVPTYGFPEDPPQAGTSMRPDLFEPRFWSCAMRNGSLWATHHQGNPVRQRWYEFDLRGWPTSGLGPVLAQSGDINPGGSVRTFFGSIAVGPTNAVALTVSRSSPTEFISMNLTTRTAGDSAGFTEPLTLVQPSTGPDFTGRWGDYSGAEPEPDRGTGFWLHGEFRNGAWRTWIEPVDAGAEPLIYCTAKLSSTGCSNPIAPSSPSALPVSGADDYFVTASNTQGQKNGLLFAGINGTASIPFNGGTLCAVPPLKRGPLHFSGGNAPDNCSGSFAQLVNDGTLLPTGLDAGPGNTAWYQWWYRDPQNGPGNLGTALSNSLELSFF